MYIPNVVITIKKDDNQNSDTLSLKTIINELDLLKKAVIIQQDIFLKKDLLLLANKFIKKADPSNAEEYYNSYLKKKIQNW